MGGEEGGQGGKGEGLHTNEMAAAKEKRRPASECQRADAHTHTHTHAHTHTHTFSLSLSMRRVFLFKLHYMMLALVCCKTLSSTFHAIDYSFISKHGTAEEGWAITYYIINFARVRCPICMRACVCMLSPLTLTHTHSHTHTLTRSHTRTHSLTHSLTHTHTHTHTRGLVMMTAGNAAVLDCSAGWRWLRLYQASLVGKGEAPLYDCPTPPGERNPQHHSHLSCVQRNTVCVCVCVCGGVVELCVYCHAVLICCIFVLGSCVGRVCVCRCLQTLRQLSSKRLPKDQGSGGA